MNNTKEQINAINAAIARKEAQAKEIRQKAEADNVRYEEMIRRAHDALGI